MNALIDRDAGPGSGTIFQRMRLWSGLVLLGYVCFHYVNHALGHVSLAAMEAMLEWQAAITATLPGKLALYGALAVHVGLALLRIANMRSFRRPLWEWTQIGLGLAIPWFLFSHITYTRGAESLLGVEVDYAHELALLWPEVWIQQSLLLLVVWLHACIGLHFWLRLRPWYTRAMPWLAALAAVFPVLAETGWVAAARREHDRLAVLSQGVQGSGAAGGDGAQGLAAMLGTLRNLEIFTQRAALAAVAVVLAVVAIRFAMRRVRRRIKVTYGDGIVVNSTSGHTLLEVSRSAGVPHMSVCGGRARCSTCRTLVTAGRDNLTTPTDAESLLLRKLNADQGIRLACQARVHGDVSIRPLIQPQASMSAPRASDPLGWGVEREIAVMFVDIRGFSKISEKSLPYDVVFILNSLFGEVGGEIEGAGGYIDKFMGDGLMALFGLSSTPAQASWDALRAAIAAQQATRKASRMLTQHLHEPLRIGIGLHTGTAVIGRIGRTSDQTSPSRLTAIGDTVNIAARLEAATKELKAGIVVSAKTLEAAGIAITAEIGNRSSISVHNISEPVDVVALDETGASVALLQPNPLEKNDSRGSNAFLETLSLGRSAGKKKTDRA